MNVGRRIYFDVITGDVLVDTGERAGAISPTSVEHEVKVYKKLFDRVRDSFDYIELQYGEYSRDFTSGTLVGIDLEKRIPKFQYNGDAEADSLVILEKPLSIEIKELKESNKTPIERLNDLNVSTATLEELKAAKIAELDYQCNLAIEKGFVFEINSKQYLFSCSIAAQSNFQGTDTLFKDGFIQSAEWTVVEVATGQVKRIIVDRDTFNMLKLQVFGHINSNISRFRNDLHKQVTAATTKEAVIGVVW